MTAEGAGLPELKHTPLHEEHVALGARMVEFAGWEMPVQYSGVMEEHRAVRASAGAFDVCHMAEFRVFGFEAFDALQTLFTNDLGRLHATEPHDLGKAQYTLMCGEDGGIIDDLIVYHSGDLEFLIVANASNREAVWTRLDGMLPEGVERADESDRTGLIALQGPKALDVVRALAGEGFEPPRRFRLAEAMLDTLPVLLARTGYTGEDGVEVFCAASRAAEVWRLFMSFSEVTPCGLGARDTLRLEMGYPLYGLDMDRSTTPAEAGLGRYVALGKEAFSGRGAIAEMAERGPERTLVGLTVDEGVPRHGYPVLHDGTEVGKVASGTFSPTLGHGIATAYVPVALSEEGTRLSVAIRRRTVPATVVRPPFVKETSLSKR